jgi:hypothetical protein
MANRARTGFAKRQKELARSEKRTAKLARRQRGKEEAPGTDATQDEAGEASRDGGEDGDGGLP